MAGNNYGHVYKRTSTNVLSLLEAVWYHTLCKSNYSLADLRYFQPWRRFVLSLSAPGELAVNFLQSDCMPTARERDVIEVQIQ